jgi:hypothetical protein
MLSYTGVEAISLIGEPTIPSIILTIAALLDVLSQYFSSIKNGANSFYINKVSKTYYSAKGFNSLILN